MFNMFKRDQNENYALYTDPHKVDSYTVSVMNVDGDLLYSRQVFDVSLCTKIPRERLCGYFIPRTNLQFIYNILHGYKNGWE